jgi:carbon-monoxide dehydrogenase medium subunit
MHAFNYHKASSVADAMARLAASDDGRALAGGQTLIAAMKMRLSAPSDLVDLAGIAELRGIKVESSGVAIGAMTTHATVAASPEIKKAIPALAFLASQIGDPMVRNMGTIGGSVANNDPAADYPAAVLGLGATVVTSKRKITADKFFTAMYETALEPGEIITSISFPVPKRAGYSKFKNPASRYALVGVFVAETANGIRVAITGAGPCVFRFAELEKALGKSFSPDAVKGIEVPATNLNSDIHASAEYRAHLISVMARRAVSQILSK